MEFLTRLSDELEGPDPRPYAGTHALLLAGYASLAYMLYEVLQWTVEWTGTYAPGPGEIVFNVIFNVIGFVPVFLVLTPGGLAFVRRELARYHGLTLQLAVVTFVLLYFLVGVPLQYASVGARLAAVENFVPGWGVPVNLALMSGTILVFLRLPLLLFARRADDGGLPRMVREWRAHREVLAFIVLAGTFGMVLAYSQLVTVVPFSAWSLAWLAYPLVVWLVALTQWPLLKFGKRATKNTQEPVQGDTRGNTSPGASRYDAPDASQDTSRPGTPRTTPDPARSPQGTETPTGLPHLTLADLFTIGIGALALLASGTLPCLGSLLVVWGFIYLIFGTGLGREHFYLSFVPKSRDFVEVVNFVLLSIVIFLPFATLVGFIDLANFTTDVSVTEFYGMVVVWAFFVGISEELLFRSGVLVLFADWFRARGVERPRTWGLVVSAVLFGLAHASKGWDYALCAILAGFAYGLLFLKTRNLFGPIVLHMTVDVIAVAFFGAAL